LRPLAARLAFEGGALLTLAALGACGRDRPPTPVILISIDTLRPDHLGAYGYGEPTSPHIDAFRKDAVRFVNSFSHAPSTLVAHASLLTSLLPPHHGATVSNDHALPLEVTTLAEVLQAHGYATASWNGGIQLDPAFGLDQGFDVYKSVKPRGAPAESLVDKTDRFAHVVEQARAWIQGRADDRFFVFLHTYEVHHPYSPDPRDLDVFRKDYAGRLPDFVTVELLKRINDGTQPVEERDRRHVLATYDAEIRSMDRAFGDLVAFLQESGLYDRSLVVLTSDHGEEFGEHGKMGWHSHTLYDELLRVPLLVKLPERRLAGASPGLTARGIDVAPTILAALGMKVPPAFAGRDLLVSGTPPTGSDLTLASRDVTTPNVVVALRTPGWKLIDARLYDLENDPGERKDVAAAQPARARELAARRQAMVESRPSPRSRVAGADEELRERLRALGYLN
jgi:arylsulfatase A-like enzyme